MEYVLLIGGLLVLIVSGELLVTGAIGLALRFNVSKLVIGMTIVAFGTSAPELIVSLKAALENHAEIALGNVIGSNIANITLVLGLTSVVLPISIKRSILTLDWPIMILTTILFNIFIIDNNIEMYEGVIFTVGIVAFNTYMLWNSKKRSKKKQSNDELESIKKSNVVLNILMIVMASIGLGLSSNWLLKGAVQIAYNFGVSEHVIGVTIVAFGTSVPELITSAVAAFKKQADISVGNLIGSNIFNILGVLGITSLVREIPVGLQVINNDIFWVMGVSFLIFPLMRIGYKINRVKGALLFVCYCIYIYFVVS